MKLDKFYKLKNELETSNATLFKKLNIAVKGPNKLWISLNFWPNPSTVFFWALKFFNISSPFVISCWYWSNKTLWASIIFLLASSCSWVTFILFCFDFKILSSAAISVLSCFIKSFCWFIWSWIMPLWVIVALTFWASKATIVCCARSISRSVRLILSFKANSPWSKLFKWFWLLIWSWAFFSKYFPKSFVLSAASSIYFWYLFWSWSNWFWASFSLIYHTLYLI